LSVNAKAQKKWINKEGKGRHANLGDLVELELGLLDDFLHASLASLEDLQAGLSELVRMATTLSVH